MSDDQPSLLLHAESSDAAVAAQAALPSPTAGQMLKQARLRSGLSLEGLGARVKVTVARLQALEDDQFDAWPNINVLRAAAASVCRHVQLDPVVILDRLPKAEKIQLTVAGPAAQVGFRDRAGFTLRRSGGGRALAAGLDSDGAPVACGVLLSGTGAYAVGRPPCGARCTCCGAFGDGRGIRPGVAPRCRSYRHARWCSGF